MCSNPTNIPDQFVAFNVPLGLDWLPEAASDLSNNVFVDLVITAELRGSDTTVPQNDIAEQFKTRLTASIPVVDGGRNVFCDQITAKTGQCPGTLLQSHRQTDTMARQHQDPHSLTFITCFC